VNEHYKKVWGDPSREMVSKNDKQYHDILEKKHKIQESRRKLKRKLYPR